MPVFVCPITHTIWGMPDDPAGLSSVNLSNVDSEIKGVEKSLASSRAAGGGVVSESERKKICKKLDQLSVLVRARHEKSRQPADLDKAVDVASDALAHTLPTDAESSARHHTLAALLATRYTFTRNKGDLDASIAHFDFALQPSVPVPAAHHSRRQSTLGTGEAWMYAASIALAERYQAASRPEDLNRAETFVRGALEVKGLDGTALAERQEHLAYLLYCKNTERSRQDPSSVSVPDLLATIGLAKQALARLPRDDVRRTMYRLRLATYLNASFTHTRNSAHLDEAIAIYDEEFPELGRVESNASVEKVLRPSLPTPPPSSSSIYSFSSGSTAMSAAEDESKPYHLKALGDSLLTRFTSQPKPNKDDLVRATSCFKRALRAILALLPATETAHPASAHPLWEDLSCGLVECVDLSGRKRFNVVVCGGGPVGQTCALAIASQSVERSLLTGGPAIKIVLYESRLMPAEEEGKVRWRGADDNPPNTRRQQVITLQDAVIGNYERAGIPWADIVWSKKTNPEGGERCWPTSRQVPIRQVEDAITEYVQEKRLLKMCIEYRAKSMTAEEFDAIRPTCDLFIGADGAGPKSFTINHPEFRFSRNTYFEEQMDRALGVFVDVPGPHRPQAKAVFLTISQTIYLLNSNYGTLGYLNIRLPGAYMNAMKDNETLESLSNADDILRRRVAFVIRGGLALFDLPESSVKAINRIELPMSNSTRYLATANRSPVPNPREQPKAGSTFPVVLAGDAAIKFNFWPGRGANSGLIGAWGLTTTLFDVLPGVRQGQSIPVERFMLQAGLLSTLQVREHEGRGGYIQSINIDQRFEDVFGAHKPAEPEPVPALPVEALGVPSDDPGRKPRGPRPSIRRPNGSRSASPAPANGELNGHDKNEAEDTLKPLESDRLAIDRAPSPAPSFVSSMEGALPDADKLAEETPLTQAVEVVRRATKAAKTRRGAPISAQRRKTILERAKDLDLPEQGFLLDPREMETLVQYDRLITRELINRLQTRRDGMTGRDDWKEIGHVTVSDREFQDAVRKLHPALKKLVFLSEPWPTSQMNPRGWEVQSNIFRQPGIATSE